MDLCAHSCEHETPNVFVKMCCCLFFCSDIDECKGSEEVCPGHACINQVGSYRCECATGYNFNSISRTCEGLEPWRPLPKLYRLFI